MLSEILDRNWAWRGVPGVGPLKWQILWVKNIRGCHPSPPCLEMNRSTTPFKSSTGSSIDYDGLRWIFHSLPSFSSWACHANWLHELMKTPRTVKYKYSRCSPCERTIGCGAELFDGQMRLRHVLVFLQFRPARVASLLDSTWSIGT